MDFNSYKKHFTEGSIGRYDMAPLYADPNLFKILIADMISPFRNIEFDKIIALDSTGFILGSAISIQLNKGLVLSRKGGKLPLDNTRKITSEFMDYTGKKKSLEIDIGMIKLNENYLIIDDWVETGSQV